MNECASCGIPLPESESDDVYGIVYGRSGKPYCCEDCAHDCDDYDEEA